MRTTRATFVATLLSAIGLTVGAFGSATSADAVRGAHGQRVCTEATAGEASCHALRLVDANGNSVAGPNATTPPASGKVPADIRDAYKLSGSSSGGRTVAIVDAYGYPNAERDLGVYRSQFGLPLCSTANGCLRIFDQNGGTNLPRYNAGWATEQALDLDAVSATCPDCRIVLVQARSASFSDLGTAVVTVAEQPGVVAMSNSYGGSDAPDSTYGKYYDHPGQAVTASTGDNSYQGGSYPASSAYVTAVGGTSLARASGTARGWPEAVWSGAGSGCSTYNTVVAPATVGTGCAKRAMADVSAVADPQTGLAVYAPTSRTTSSWAQFGGTSLSAPIIAAVYALSGNTAGTANTIPYNHAGSLFDVTSGSNGTCATTQWCKARTGWDGPTGLGTPNGSAAF
jgi:subtilase family serine protease